jgi:hypothetical protein
VRPGAVVAAAFVGCLGSTAFAHEPFSITTEARALPDGLAMHVTMAGRTATLACPGAAGEPHRLTPDDLVRHRTALEGCAKTLYAVTSSGRRLEPTTALLALTEEGDFDARLAYPPAPPGPLVFDAVHLSRLPDAMYGAELTVTGDRVFLGQKLLRASAPTLTVTVLTPTGGSVPADPPARSFAHYLRFGLVFVVALGLVWLVRRRFTSR